MNFVNRSVRTRMASIVGIKRELHMWWFIFPYYDWFGAGLYMYVCRYDAFSLHRHFKCLNEKHICS